VIGEELGRHFALEKVLIRHATTDGDGRLAAGLESGLKTVYPMWEVVRQADTIHLGRSQTMAVLKANFSAGMFPGRTKLDKQEICQRVQECTQC
jgi:hypothetical protein